MILTCRSCSSKRILRGSRVASHALFVAIPVTLQIPVSGGFKAHVQSAISVQVCVDCGHLETYAENLTELRRAYASLGEPLGLSSGGAADGPTGG